jgi:hypothetical protein
MVWLIGICLQHILAALASPMLLERVRVETVYYYLTGGKTCRDLEAGYKERGIGIEKRNCKTRGKTNTVTQTTRSKHSTRKRKQ